MKYLWLILSALGGVAAGCLIIRRSRATLPFFACGLYSKKAGKKPLCLQPAEPSPNESKSDNSHYAGHTPEHTEKDRTPT